MGQLEERTHGWRVFGGSVHCRQTSFGVNALAATLGIVPSCVRIKTISPGQMGPRTWTLAMRRHQGPRDPGNRSPAIAGGWDFRVPSQGRHHRTSAYHVFKERLRQERNIAQQCSCFRYIAQCSEFEFSLGRAVTTRYGKQ